MKSALNRAWGGILEETSPDISEGEPVQAEVGPESDIGNMRVIYGVLFERYASNTSLQWQIPMYVIPAQAALYVGIAAGGSDLGIFLGALACAVGLIGPIVMRRIELTARWDRQLLDEYEQRIAPESDLLLLHDSQFLARLNRMELRSSRKGLRRFELELMKAFPPSLTVMLIMATIGVAGLFFGISASNLGLDHDSANPDASGATRKAASDRLGSVHVRNLGQRRAGLGGER